MKKITKSVKIQLDSRLVKLKVCSIDGSTGPMIPVSREPINTPIKNSKRIRFRVFVSNVLVCIEITVLILSIKEIIIII